MQFLMHIFLESFLQIFRKWNNVGRILSKSDADPIFCLPDDVLSRVTGVQCPIPDHFLFPWYFLIISQKTNFPFGSPRLCWYFENTHEGHRCHLMALAATVGKCTGAWRADYNFSAEDVFWLTLSSAISGNCPMLAQYNTSCLLGSHLTQWCGTFKCIWNQTDKSTFLQHL